MRHLNLRKGEKRKWRACPGRVGEFWHLYMIFRAAQYAKTGSLGSACPVWDQAVVILGKLFRWCLAGPVLYPFLCGMKAVVLVIALQKYEAPDRIRTALKSELNKNSLIKVHPSNSEKEILMQKMRMREKAHSFFTFLFPSCCSTRPFPVYTYPLPPLCHPQVNGAPGMAMVNLCAPFSSDCVA